LIISHELSATGAPRVCFELAQVASSLGADAMVALQDRPEPDTAGEICAFAKSALPSSLPSLDFRCTGMTREALSSGIVVVSTAVSRNALFISTFREMYVSDAMLVWWIHEGKSVMDVLGDAALSLALKVLADPHHLHAVVFVSEFCRSFWVDAAAARGLSIAAPTFVLRWGVPDWKRAALDAALLDPTGPAALRQSFGFGDNDFVFLMLASFNPLKGHAGVVKALMHANANCPSSCRLRLISAGVGISWPSSFPTTDMKWVLTHDDFRFLPAIPDVSPYFAASDAYVSNSKRGGETWGLSTLEAATAGRVVLASGVGGTLEQLEHNVSALFHSVGQGEGDEEVGELAANMCAVAVNANLAIRISSAARDHARGKFGEIEVDRALVELFGSLARLRGGVTQPLALWKGGT
jgi:glycosyltransferase involved in cell wall biosynthesis